MSKVKIDKKAPSVEEIAKRRGFFWPSFEIYGGSSGFYDYGPYGTLLKLNIEKIIREQFVVEEGFVLIESPTLNIKEPWIASGHTESMTDIISECKKCGEPYRLDHLVEAHIKKSTDGMSIAQLEKEINKNKITCPKCNSELNKAYDFNLMFPTYIGPGKNKTEAVLRGETAQTTYMSFKRLFEVTRRKIPFGVLQIGKSFRNEISPRQGLVRLREFSQAEAQYFVNPKDKSDHPRFDEIKNIEIPVLTKHHQVDNKEPAIMKLEDIVKNKHANKLIVYYLGRSIQLYQKMGIDMRKLVLRQHKDDERSFYSSDTWDVEFISDFYGRIELVGIADRTDYDLKRHMEHTKQDMHVNINGDKFVPHVVETAYGIDRPILCIMESCLKEDNDRTYFSFPAAVAPYQVAVFPLVRKEGLPEKAREVFNSLRKDGFLVLYDEVGSIGKMYYRQDEVGTRACVTIDFDTKKDNTVTVRDRDTQQQVRVKIDDLSTSLKRLFDGEAIEKIGELVKK